MVLNPSWSARDTAERVVDGNVVYPQGVSAGSDMALRLAVEPVGAHVDRSTSAMTPAAVRRAAGVGCPKPMTSPRAGDRIVAVRR